MACGQGRENKELAVEMHITWQLLGSSHLADLDVSQMSFHRSDSFASSHNNTLGPQKVQETNRKGAGNNHRGRC